MFGFFVALLFWLLFQNNFFSSICIF